MLDTNIPSSFQHFYWRCNEISWCEGFNRSYRSSKIIWYNRFPRSYWHNWFDWFDRVPWSTWYCSGKRFSLVVLGCCCFAACNLTTVIVGLVVWDCFWAPDKFQFHQNINVAEWDLNLCLFLFNLTSFSFQRFPASVHSNPCNTGGMVFN